MTVVATRGTSASPAKTGVVGSPAGRNPSHSVARMEQNSSGGRSWRNNFAKDVWEAAVACHRVGKEKAMVRAER